MLKMFIGFGLGEKHVEMVEDMIDPPEVLIVTLPS